MLHLVLFHLFLQLLVLLDFVVKHHCYLIDPFFELLVLLLKFHDILFHGEKLSFLLKPTFLGRFPILLKPIRQIIEVVKITDQFQNI